MFEKLKKYGRFEKEQTGTVIITIEGDCGGDQTVTEKSIITLEKFLELLEEYEQVKDVKDLVLIKEDCDIDFDLVCADNFHKVFQEYLPFCSDYGYDITYTNIEVVDKEGNIVKFIPNN